MPDLQLVGMMSASRRWSIGCRRCTGFQAASIVPHQASWKRA